MRPRKKTAMVGRLAACAAANGESESPKMGGSR